MIGCRSVHSFTSPATATVPHQFDAKNRKKGLASDTLQRFSAFASCREGPRNVLLQQRSFAEAERQESQCSPSGCIGYRHVRITERRTRVDWAFALRERWDEKYAAADQVVLVMDNLNTHTPGSFYEALTPSEARRLTERLEIHYTPKHGSWLNIAECELSVLGPGSGIGAIWSPRCGRPRQSPYRDSGHLRRTRRLPEPRNGKGPAERPRRPGVVAPSPNPTEWPCSTAARPPEALFRLEATGAFASVTTYGDNPLAAAEPQPRCPRTSRHSR